MVSVHTFGSFCYPQLVSLTTVPILAISEQVTCSAGLLHTSLSAIKLTKITGQIFFILCLKPGLVDSFVYFLTCTDPFPLVITVGDVHLL